MVIFHGRLKIDESQVPISFYFTEALQDCCLRMLLASMKAWILVCTVHDHPNAIPQWILICALCLD